MRGVRHKMKNNALADLVDPFFGAGRTEFPRTEGLAATWFFPKAQTGNTHPGACLPFGMVSVCAYSGAYVTGYGTNAVNTNGRPPELFDELTATGFTHFHQSGTGAIRSYYNYFRVSPLPASDTPLDTRYRLVDEDASPGYYAASLQECGIRAEIAVTPCGAIHQYTFPSEARPHIAIDFASGGLPLTSQGGQLPSAAMIAISDSGFEGHVVMEGITIYVCGMLRQEKSSSCLFVNAREHGERSISFTADDDIPASFGVRLEAVPSQGNTSDLLLAFSLKSANQARKNLASFRDQSFEEARLDAKGLWEESLGRIQVEGHEPDRRLFYSAFYHSLIKPCQLKGESPFYDNGHPFYTDFSTLWDQYKTALPLIFTLFPDEGTRMINSLLATADTVGEFSTAILLSRNMTRCAQQARGLTHHVLADARIRHLQNIDWQWALDLMISDLEKESNGDFHTTGIAHPFTHTLDLSQAAFCTALIASSEDNRALRDRVWDWTSRWRNVYDRETGILGESTYYEGGAWNYSFRLLHDMAGRIDLHGGDGDFVADLERFFGYDAPPAQQQVDPSDGDCMARGLALNRFEGFNNEPDMETPYAFIYAGRHDRTCEVVRDGMRHQFRLGRGGLPGNNDSGGLTSAYVWNAIGLFPVTGQPYMLIGSPLFTHITLNLPHAQLRIVAEGTSDEACYVGSATLNGKTLDRAYVTMKEVLEGGELKLTMRPAHSGWAKDERPPSYQRVEQLSRGDF